MRGNVPVRFGKGPMEKDQQWYLASGLLHGTLAFQIYKTDEQ